MLGEENITVLLLKAPGNFLHTVHVQNLANSIALTAQISLPHTNLSICLELQLIMCSMCVDVLVERNGIVQSTYWQHCFIKMYRFTSMHSTRALSLKIVMCSMSQNVNSETFQFQSPFAIQYTLTSQANWSFLITSPMILQVFLYYINEFYKSVFLV